MFNGIEQGLFETKKMKRKQMKIRVGLKSKNKEFDPMKLIINVTHIIHMLECFDVEDFMFILDLSRLSLKLDDGKMLQELTEISSNVHVRSHRKCFVISKK